MTKDFLRALPDSTNPEYYVFDPEDTQLPSLEEAIQTISVPVIVEEDEEDDER